MRHCYEMINEFNGIAHEIDPDVRQQIYEGKTINTSDFKVRMCCALWRQIQERMNLIAPSTKTAH